MYVADILRAKGAGAVTIVQSETIETAAKMLRDGKFGCLVVRDRGGQLCGIISERDIIRGLAEKGGRSLSCRVEDFMTREVKVCKTTDSVKDIMQLMSLRHIRHVPVVEKGELLGMISSTDVVKYRLEEKATEVAILKDINRSR